MTELPYFLRDGDLALLVFFILPGDALSAKFLATGDLDVVRPARPHALFSPGRNDRRFLCGSLLMALGLAPHREAAAAVNHTDWFATAHRFPADAPSASAGTHSSASIGT